MSIMKIKNVSYACTSRIPIDRDSQAFLVREANRLIVNLKASMGLIDDISSQNERSLDPRYQADPRVNPAIVHSPTIGLLTVLFSGPLGIGHLTSAADLCRHSFEVLKLEDLNCCLTLGTAAASVIDLLVFEAID
jgi:hypothetical protein